MTEIKKSSPQEYSQSNRQQGLTKKILVLDQANILTKTIQETFSTEPFLNGYQIISAKNSELFAQFLVQEKINILCIVDYEAEKWVPLLQLARQTSPLTIRMMIAEKWPQNSIVSVTNIGQVFKCLALSIDDADLKRYFIEADIESDTASTKSQLKSIYAEQNRKLESLNLDLEKMVEEKTIDIRRSKDQIDDKVHRIRQLTTFIKDLSTQVTFQEFMSLVRRDIRKFSKTGDPVLMIQTEFDIVEIIYFSSGAVVKQLTKNKFHFPSELIPNDKMTAQFLADFFQRPFIQTISIPLAMTSAHWKETYQPLSLLTIEHSMTGHELQYFLEHLNERLQPMSMAVDRAFLQKELSHQYYRWERTFDGIKDPIAIIDSEYGVIRSNKNFSDVSVHHACYQEFAGRSSYCSGCPLSEALKAGQLQTRQVEINGRHYEVSSYPIHQYSEGKSTSVINQYKDITHSRQLYAKLLQSEKMGAIGLLAGNIAHELNNPLTGIRSLTQLLIQQANQQPQLMNDLKEVEKASMRSQKIIRNLLEFSSGSTQLSQKISLDEIFERTIPLFKTVTRNLRTDFQLATSEYSVYVEPQLIQQVIFNLIQNASQAMEGKEKSGKLTIRSYLDSDQFVVLSIQDDGSGIPKELQQKIFEPFFTTKKEGQGTALGLSLSREITRRFGGDLEVQSQVGQGATFLIRLPQAKDQK